MDRIVLFWFLSLLTASFCYWMPTNAQEKERQQDVSRLFDDLSDGEKQDASQDLEDEIPSYRRKRVCAVGGGMNNQCTVGEIDRQMKMREMLLKGLSPGKRRVEMRNAVEESASDIQPASDNMVWNRRQEIETQKKGLRLLMAILNQIESESTHKKKRGCQFNLGGHCSTETAAFLADRWHYLDSPMSPGRKRSPQIDGITRKLVQGKLFADNE